MTSQPPTPLPEYAHIDRAELADLHALGALAAEESTAFEALLAARDPALLRELERLRPATEALAQSLAAASEIAPPAHLRATILAAASAASQCEQELDRELREHFAPAPHAAHAHERARAHHAPPAPPSLGIFVQRIAEGRWRPTGLPGVWAKPLFKDRRADRSTMLVKCDPGAYIPHHDHQGVEELIVLEGDLQVGETLLKAGDYIRTVAGQDHGDAFSPSGCVCLFFTSHGVIGVHSQLAMFVMAMRRRIAAIFGR